MTDPLAQIHSSQSHTFLPLGRLAPGSTLELSPHSTDESWPPGITELRQEHHTVLIPLQRSAPGQFTLKLTLLLTPPATESRSTEVNCTLQIVPVILALVSSSMQEYRPWFSLENIETTPAYV